MEESHEVVRRIQAGSIARVDRDQEHECFSAACSKRSELGVTLHGPGDNTEPNYRCIEHWPPILSLLVDLGYKVEYTDAALALLEPVPR